ncbi:AAA family ATPase [Shewanella marina]|uniref:AAA family ATPase n=1 Tax=Shewanella marina TaxID=487319 RepID=UPI000472A7E8|nr:AAA family ATPase [Shewanella marina]
MKKDSNLLPTQDALLQRLQHNACYSQQMVMVVGKQGAGKTQIATSLVSDTETFNTAWLTCAKHTDSGEIRRKVVFQLFSDPIFDQDESLTDIFIRLAAGVKQHLHIVIDDAHHMPLALWAEFMVLSQMKCHGYRIAITTFVSPQFKREFFGELSAKQRSLVLPISVPALSLTEREQLYVQLINQSGVNPFLAIDVIKERLATLSGTPKDVIELSKLAIKPEIIAAAKPKWPVIVSGSVASILICSIAVALLFSESSEVVAETSPAELVTDTVLVQSVVVNDKETDDNVSTIAEPSISLASQSNITEANAIVKKQPFIDDTEVVAELALAQDLAELKPSEFADVTPDEQAAVEISSIATDSVLTANRTAELVADNAVSVETKSEVDVIKVDEAAISASTAANAMAQAEVLTDDDAPTQDKAPIKEASDTLLSSSSPQSDGTDTAATKLASNEEPQAPTEAKIAAIEPEAVEDIMPELAALQCQLQNRQGYTTQLGTVKRQKTLAKFIAELDMQDNICFARQKQWLIVFAGDYQDKQLALTAAKEMESKYRLKQVFVRTWTSLARYQAKHVG